MSIRLRFGSHFVVVIPTDGEEKFTVEVTDVMSRPVQTADRKKALRQLMHTIGKLREQVFFDEFDGNVEEVAG